MNTEGESEGELNHDLGSGVVVADIALPRVGGQEQPPRHPVGQHRAGTLGRRGAGQPGLILQITEGRVG